MTQAPQTQLIVVDPSEVSAITALATANGVEVEQVPQRGIEPVTSVTLLLVGTAAAVNTVHHIFFEQRKGGQVIDLRPGAPEPFYRTKKVTYGMVIIFAVDGEVNVTVKEPDGVFGKVISTLPNLLTGGGSARQVVGVVTKTFGNDVEVETVDIPADGDQ
jgi:hypothetical protein